jgi:hypothetical protein
VVSKSVLLFSGLMRVFFLKVEIEYFGLHDASEISKLKFFKCVVFYSVSVFRKSSEPLFIILTTFLKDSEPKVIEVFDLEVLNGYNSFFKVFKNVLVLLLDLVFLEEEQK